MLQSHGVALHPQRKSLLLAPSSKTGRNVGREVVRRSSRRTRGRPENKAACRSRNSEGARVRGEHWRKPVRRLGAPFPQATLRQCEDADRYLNAWSAISTFLDHRGILAPSQVTYRLCTEYPDFRTAPPKGLMRPRSNNTALTELKVFSAILQEAVKREWIQANPCTRLGLKRTPPKKKPEITDAEATEIEQALASRDAWMRDCWLVAMRQGCRLSETATPLKEVDTGARTITFNAKGNRIHTAPLHPDLIPLIDRARSEGRSTLVDLPEYAAKKWHQFFKRIGLPHLSFHCTRVTVVTKLARSGAPIYKTKAYVGHASDTVHAIYQRLMPVDVSDLGAALSNPTAETPDAPAANPTPIRQSSARRASRNQPTSSA